VLVQRGGHHRFGVLRSDVHRLLVVRLGYVWGPWYVWHHRDGGGNGSGSGAQGAGGSGCATSQLSVAQVNPSVGAGQYYSTLVFTNTSHSSCTLSGYPGVSYVVGGGVQSGNPAVRAGGTVATVTLAPGGKADSVLHDSNGIGGYSPQQCRLTAAQGLRIYPPNNTAALFLPWKTSHCAGLGIHPLSIAPVTAQ